MAEVFQTHIVSQDKLLFAGEVVQVVATLQTGEVGILANHIPLMAMLKPGQVRLKFADDKEEVLYVSGGFLEVQPKQVIILADDASRAEELDEARIREAKARAEALMKDPSKAIDHDVAQRELIQLTAQLDAVKRASRH